ncbi:MAG: phosphodiester glycosidase family protein [Myxococcota bacterium]
MTWLDVALRFAAEQGVDPRWTDALACLASPEPRGGPPPGPERPWTGGFEDLEVADLPVPALDDVDPEQAAMFGRRIEAVSARLAALGGPEGRVLRVGLRVRLAGMAEARGPQAVRVRALADFYYSLAAQLESARAGRVRSLEDAARSVWWASVEPGIEHARVDGPGPMGPMHVNVLRIDPRRFAPRVVDLRAHGGDLAAFAVAHGAPVATSGGFFLYSEPDIGPPSQRGDPVGLFVSGGVVHGPAWFPRGALVSGPAGVDVGVVSVHPEPLTRAVAKRGPDVPSVARVGTRTVATGRSLEVPLDGAVFTGVSEAPVLEHRLEGAPVRIDEGIAGGPMLVRNGEVCIDLRSEGFWGTAPPVTFSQDETGDQNLLPRLAVGLDREGRVLVAAVDGRNFERALGMTLRQLADWMRLLGCERATNLDGGSSKRMVVHGREVDLASTEVRSDGGATPVRPVRTGILWLPRG